MISLYALVFAGSFASTGLALIWLYRLAPQLGLIDRPRGRKRHGRPTPIVGGLAISIGAAVWISVGSALAVPTLQETLMSHIGFICAALLLAVVGVIDDRWPVSAWLKLFAQLVACLVAIVLDQVVVGDVGLDIGPFAIVLGHFAAPFTVLVMMTITNAINMIDGADGLAGGIVLSGLLIIAKATATAQFSTALLVLGLVGGLTAFLVVNAPLRPGKPALVFLGDCGSLVLGFTLAYLAVELSSLPGRVFKPSTALWFFTIPVFDTIWLYMRRTVHARAPFAPGRDHIHHMLIERVGLSWTVWILTGLSGAMAAGAYLAERLGAVNIAMVALWIIAFIVYGLATHRLWIRAWARSRQDEKLCPVATTVQEGKIANP